MSIVIILILMLSNKCCAVIISKNDLNDLNLRHYGNKTESHYRSARLVQAFKILELKMMLRFTESCHCLLSGSFILLN